MVSARARIALFCDTSASAEWYLSCDASELNSWKMEEVGVRATHIIESDLDAFVLRRVGGDGSGDPLWLRSVGFDSLHLTNTSFCNKMILAFGAPTLKRMFLVTAQDAVAFAGTDAAHALGVSHTDLLDLCGDCPTEATHVLKQLLCRESLKDVSVDVLTRTGLRANALTKLGLTFQDVMSQTGASVETLSVLGYDMPITL